VDFDPTPGTFRREEAAMRFVMIPTLLGVLTLAEVASAQVYVPPRSFPVPAQYYP
jgi:hypothetical protein